MKGKLKLAGRLSGGKWDKLHDIGRRVYDEDGLCPTIPTSGGGEHVVKILQRGRGKNPGGLRETDSAPAVTTSCYQQNVFILEESADVLIGAIRGRYQNDGQTAQMLELNGKDTTNAITTVQKDNVVIQRADGVYTHPSAEFDRGPLKDTSRCVSVTPGAAGAIIINGKQYYVRRLTPLECWRLFDFKDEQFYKAKAALEKTYYKGKDKASTQLYKQAGNTIIIPCLAAILGNIKGLRKSKRKRHAQNKSVDGIKQLSIFDLLT